MIVIIVSSKTSSNIVDSIPNRTKHHVMLNHRKIGTILVTTNIKYKLESIKQQYLMIVFIIKD